jgi:hypothetical protein
VAAAVHVNAVEPLRREEAGDHSGRGAWGRGASSSAGGRLALTCMRCALYSRGWIKQLKYTYHTCLSWSPIRPARS